MVYAGTAAEVSAAVDSRPDIADSPLIEPPHPRRPFSKRLI
jgi:hypothetical protein